MIKDLVLKNRSYRRFFQDVPVERHVLEELVDLARLSSSGMNLQPLKYVIVNDPQECAKIFPNLRWAGYIKTWGGPKQGEQPSAYIVMVLDTDISSHCFWDHGIAAQSIMLGATEKGFGGCMFGSFDKDGLKSVLNLDARYQVMMVLALGKPKETVVLEPVNDNGDIRYYRDEDEVHHVPKRKLEDLIL